MSEQNVQTIENATPDDVLPGDHITWKKTWAARGVTCTEIREGIAHHRNEDDDWCAEDGMWIAGGDGNGSAITIRRPVKSLPTEDGTQIIPAHGVIEAVWDEVTYTTRHATYDATEGVWVGVWRGENDHSTYEMYASYITPDTWKTKERAS